MTEVAELLHEGLADSPAARGVDIVPMRDGRIVGLRPLLRQ